MLLWSGELVSAIGSGLTSFGLGVYGKVNKMDIAKLLLNPARLRILQYIELHGETTASDVCQSIKDIPKATVYRHTKLLQEDGLLCVVKENRVRGAMEKIYTVNRELFINDADNMSHLAAGYFLGLLSDIERYLKNRDFDVKKDMIFFNSAVLNVTDEEYRQMLDKIASVLREYVELIENRKVRKLSMISSFPTD